MRRCPKGAHDQRRPAASGLIFGIMPRHSTFFPDNRVVPRLDKKYNPLPVLKQKPGYVHKYEKEWNILQTYKKKKKAATKSIG